MRRGSSERAFGSSRCAHCCPFRSPEHFQTDNESADLRRLVLHNLDFIFDLSRPLPPMSSLSSLTVHRCVIRLEHLSHVLQAPVFPSLRALALSSLHTPNMRRFFPSLRDFPSLLPQLDFVQLAQPHYMGVHRSPELPSCAVPVLVTDEPHHFSASNLLHPTIHHLHLDYSSLAHHPPGIIESSWGARALEKLNLLANSLWSDPSDSSTTLETVVLPRFLLSLRIPCPDAGGSYAPVDRLVEACERNGTKVIWDEGGDFCVNEAFWAWVKEKKAKKEQQ
jgi:hypothetical protein